MYNYYKETREDTINAIMEMRDTDIDKDVLTACGEFDAILSCIINKHSSVFDHYILPKDLKACVLENLPLCIRCISALDTFTFKEFGDLIECEMYDVIDFETRRYLVEECVASLLKEHHSCLNGVIY